MNNQALQTVTAETAQPLDFGSGVGEIMLNAPLLEQLDALAVRMADSKCTLPKHLQGNQGDCYAVAMQAVQWRMNPWVVAQKTHIVNGTLGYEAQLVNAVVQSSGMIKGTFKYEYRGDGNSMECRVGAVLANESDITWGEWLAISSVTTKNSPLWKTNPKQQLGYLQVKNFSRAYCPAAILGVYTPDELRDMDPPGEREIGPQTQVSDLSAALREDADKPAEPIEGEAEVVEGDGEAKPEGLPKGDIDAMLKRFKGAPDFEAVTNLAADAADLVADPRCTEDQKALLREAISKRREELKAIADQDPAKQ